jgi:pimeloyl-ACP methyl ester carboxylesterase
MCTAHSWDPVLPHLTVPVVAIDLPGRGNRPADPMTVTLDDCVRAVIESADEAGFDRFAVVAHSLGGVTATETAFRHPDRVAQLTYVGALVPAPGECAAVIQTGALLPPTELVTIEEKLAKAIFGTDLNDEQWALTWEAFVPDAPDVLNASVTGYPNGVPITYISMTDDMPVPPSMVEQMIANLGGRVDHRVLKTGHMVMTSKPRELAALIDDAVTRV